MLRIVTSLRSSLAMVKYQKRWGVFLILIKWGLCEPCLSQTQGPHLIQWQLGLKIKVGLRGTSIDTCLDGRAFDLTAPAASGCRGWICPLCTQHVQDLIMSVYPQGFWVDGFWGDYQHMSPTTHSTSRCSLQPHNIWFPIWWCWLWVQNT